MLDYFSDRYQTIFPTEETSSLKTKLAYFNDLRPYTTINKKFWGNVFIIKIIINRLKTGLFFNRVFAGRCILYEVIHVW